eukprot:jgi/Psemu1/23130/gm1.23130_g
MLVDHLVELFLKKLEVVFLSQTNVQNVDQHFGKGNKVYFSGVFKHLKGTNFKYHTLPDFKTWECFKDTKADLQNFKESQTGLYVAGRVMFTCKIYRIFVQWLHSPMVGSDGSDKMQDNVNKSDQGIDKDGNLYNECDNVSNPRQDKDNKRNQGNNKDGASDNKSDDSDQGKDKDGNWDNKGDNVSDPRQDIGNKSDEVNNKDGTLDNNIAKSLLVRHLEFSPKDQTHSMHAQSQNGNNNQSEQSVQLLNYSLDVTAPKFSFRVGLDFALHDIKVMLKDPDPSILYPIYGMGQKVVYIGDINCIGLVDGYVSKWYEDYDVYQGYKLFSNLMMGRAQHNNEGKLLEDDNSKSSSDSNNMSDNDKGSVYDLSVDIHSNTVAMDHVWAMEDIKCYNNMGVGPEVQFGERDRLEGNGHTFPAKEWCNLTPPAREHIKKCIHFNAGNHPCLLVMRLSDWWIMLTHHVMEKECLKYVIYDTPTEYETNKQQPNEVDITVQDMDRKQKKEREDRNERKIEHWLHLYHKRWNLSEDLEVDIEFLSLAAHGGSSNGSNKCYKYNYLLDKVLVFATMVSGHGNFRLNGIAVKQRKSAAQLPLLHQCMAVFFPFLPLAQNLDLQGEASKESDSDKLAAHVHPGGLLVENFPSYTICLLDTCPESDLNNGWAQNSSFIPQ